MNLEREVKLGWALLGRSRRVQIKSYRRSINEIFAEPAASPNFHSRVI